MKYEWWIYEIWIYIWSKYDIPNITKWNLFLYNIIQMNLKDDKQKYRVHRSIKYETKIIWGGDNKIGMKSMLYEYFQFNIF